MIMAKDFRLHDDDASFELHTPQQIASEEHGLPDGYDVIGDGWLTEWDRKSRPFVSKSSYCFTFMFAWQRRFYAWERRWRSLMRPRYSGHLAATESWVQSSHTHMGLFK